MKKMLTLVVVAALTGCATTGGRNTSVQLEFRPGSQSPGPGLTEMTVPGSERPVYVSEDVLLPNADIESDRVVSGPNDPQIEIVFTKARAKRFTIATLLIQVCDCSVACPHVIYPEFRVTFCWSHLGLS